MAGLRDVPRAKLIRGLAVASATSLRHSSEKLAAPSQKLGRSASRCIGGSSLLFVSLTSVIGLPFTVGSSIPDRAPLRGASHTARALPRGDAISVRVFSITGPTRIE
jgi:hypothetical protein